MYSTFFELRFLNSCVSRTIFLCGNWANLYSSNAIKSKSSASQPLIIIPSVLNIVFQPHSPSESILSLLATDKSLGLGLVGFTYLRALVYMSQPLAMTYLPFMSIIILAEPRQRGACIIPRMKKEKLFSRAPPPLRLYISRGPRKT